MKAIHAYLIASAWVHGMESRSCASAELTMSGTEHESGVEGLSDLGAIETVTVAEFDGGAFDGSGAAPGGFAWRPRIPVPDRRQGAAREGRAPDVDRGGRERVQGVGHYGDRKMQAGGDLLGRGFAAQLLMQIGVRPAYGRRPRVYGSVADVNRYCLNSLS